MKEAMIFAAGLGTRLRPLTDHTPKALVEVAGSPMLQHLILKLKYFGYEHIVINIHHFGEQVLSFLKAHNHFGIHIDISDERNQLLDTGGGLKKAAPLFCSESPILVHNVDIISNLDFSLLDRVATASDALLVVNQRNTSRYLLFDHDHRLSGWTNVATNEIKTYCDDFDASVCEAYAFAGIHLISPSVFPLMQSYPCAFSIIDFYLKIAVNRRITAFTAPQTMRWVDAGKPQSLTLAAQILKDNNCGIALCN